MTTLAEEWTEKLIAWRESGLSIAAWCRENSEGYHRFRYWRKRLEQPELNKAGRFVELNFAAAPICLECNGVYVHVAPDFDAHLLADILALLKRV
jgi:hypothetical protein